MIRVLFISQRAEKVSQYQSLANTLRYEFVALSDAGMVVDYLSGNICELVIFDTLSDRINFIEILKKIRPVLDTSALLLLTDKDFRNNELLKHANSVIDDDMCEQLISGIIGMNVRMRSNMEKLSATNKELADSNYRLNALYTTSSQFAGSLDKEKLIQYMLEGMDKALSYSLTCTLSFCTGNEPVIIINSLYDLSDELINALKLRIVLQYKSMFEGNKLPYEVNANTLKVKKNVKFSANKFNFNLFRFDNMFAPISLGEDFFGCVEIFKEIPFTAENATCFQTIAQQVSLPLKSATLYQQLEENNEKLKKLEMLKTEFISIVSHELRTPLASIMNPIDIMLSGSCGDLTPAFEKFLTMAKRNSKTLEIRINDLLDISKIEAGKMEYHFKNMNINSVIEDVKTNLALKAKDKEQTLLTDEGTDLPEVYGDSQRLEQVLSNLVYNAIKFTPEGKSITIKSEIVDAENLVYPEMFSDILSKLNGKYVMVSVTDEGIGISRENLMRVFDKFAQIENSLSRNIGGTGLGLPIAKQMVEAHKGAIWCDSEPEVGSTFSFIVPVA